ncbi:MAG: prolipoprotein diacylglyceryl transferase [Eubacteriales bacterium]|nr:prolipoprotein diacylglyceryl transferase [Eubacteriales bacterium]MDD3881377.1 prolipoprotein diacylglyceryl transferase [Eubacteriales bacterium]MDD4513064.1 prolipoprotein diacylglyceryl transferase [Eubacteriales bacterium]
MQEAPLYISIFGVSVPAYGVALAASVLFALPILFVCLRTKGMGKRLIPIALTMLASGMLGSRLLFCAYALIGEADYMAERGISALWMVHDGGLMMYGALFAVLIGLSLYSKAMGLKPRKTLDAAAPALCFFVSLARFSEYFTVSTGRMDVEAEMEGLMLYPFAWENAYGEWVHPIFMFEGIFLILLSVYLLIRLHKKQSAFWQFLLIYSAAQLIMESLSRYGAPAFGFVKLNMLIAAFTLAGYCIYSIVRGVRGAWISFGLLAVILGAIIGIEFALDKSSVSNALLYALMALLIVCLSAGAVRFIGAVESEERRRLNPPSSTAA